MNKEQLKEQMQNAWNQPDSLQACLLVAETYALVTSTNDLRYLRDVVTYANIDKNTISNMIDVNNRKLKQLKDGK